jgi:hypothetical protein
MDILKVMLCSKKLTIKRHPFIIQISFPFQTDTQFYIEFVSGSEFCNVGKLPLHPVQLPQHHLLRSEHHARYDGHATFCGTPECLALEVVGVVPCTETVDWWRPHI